METKQKFISQIMSGKNPSRTVEDVDATALNYAEVKAIATGNPLIRRKMELEIEVQRLKTLEQQHLASKYSMQDKILKTFPAKIANTERWIKSLEHDIQLQDKNNSENFTMQLGKNTYTERKNAGALILKAIHSGKYTDKEIGTYKGFTIIPKESLSPHIALKGAYTHIIELSDSDVGSIQRIDNYLENLNIELKETQENLTNTYQQLEITQTQTTLLKRCSALRF